MKQTSSRDIAKHAAEDLGIYSGDTVILFSGLMGLGRLENGLATILDGFMEALPRGTLVIPTFSYSWCSGETYDSSLTPCPEMGAFADFAWRQQGFHRTENPNFSFAALENRFNKDEVSYITQIDNDCFGDQSTIGRLVSLSRQKRVHILLFGGAFKDCLFRCTFIHYAQQKIGACHRYVKYFEDPAGISPQCSQLVRFLNKDEFNNQHPAKEPEFPIPATENFAPFAEDLKREGALTVSPFKYYPSRMATVNDCVDIFARHLTANPLYCLEQTTEN